MENLKAANEALDLSRKMVDLMIAHSIKESEIFVKFYEEEVKFKTQRLDSLMDEEPPKFFKKIHKEWEQKVSDLEKELDSANQKLYEEYRSIGESIELLNKEKEPSN